MLLVENYKFNIPFIIVFILLSLNLKADNQSSIAFYPFGAYTEETSAFLGAYTRYSWYPASLPDSYEAPSLELNLIVSFKKQISLLLRNKFVLDEGRYSVGIPIRYHRWPTTFYGIGNQKEPQLEESYTRCYCEFSPYVEKHLSDFYTLAFSPYLEKSVITDSEDDNPLLQESIKGFDDFFLIGTELKLQRNTTDNLFFPSEGTNSSIGWKTYQEAYGSDYSFNEITLDLRVYHTLNSSNIFAAQALYKTVFGDFPFEKYADLGKEMRGYEEHVYVNNNLLLCRIEDRIFPFKRDKWNRFGFAVFAESGHTANDIESFEFNNQKYSAGLGFRYMIQPAQKLNLRLDLAFSSDGFEMEIISFEAF